MMQSIVRSSLWGALPTCCFTLSDKRSTSCLAILACNRFTSSDADFWALALSTARHSNETIRSLFTLP